MADLGKLEDRIASLRLQLTQLRNRRQRVQARQQALTTRQARKDDLRRKILAGAIVLKQLDTGMLDRATFQVWINAAGMSDEDRALFDRHEL